MIDLERAERQKFSIVVPVYYNELNIPHTVPRLQALQERLPEWELEFIFVDDGSKDQSLALLLAAREQDARIKVIKLSKNVGSMAAIQAGLTFATGSCVGVIAADLQDPPELFCEMLEKWKQGKKVVMAVRADREEPRLQKFVSNLYYAMMDRFAIPGYPRGGFDFVLLDQQVVGEISSIKEKNTNIMSLIFWLGHEQCSIPYVRRQREHGVSRWTLAKKLKLFIDSFVAFSYTPIRMMSLLGLFLAMLGFLYGLIAIFNRIVHSAVIEGWTAIIVILTFGFGMIMIMLGIIGEYLWRILDESRKRPAYIIDEVYK
jgi:dolichol-phosphate mannosyltransferase